MSDKKLRDKLLLKIVKPLFKEWIKPRAVLKSDIEKNTYKLFAIHLWKYVNAIMEERKQ